MSLPDPRLRYENRSTSVSLITYLGMIDNIENKKEVIVFRRSIEDLEGNLHQVEETTTEIIIDVASSLYDELQTESAKHGQTLDAYVWQKVSWFKFQVAVLLESDLDAAIEFYRYIFGYDDQNLEYIDSKLDRDVRNRLLQLEIFILRSGLGLRSHLALTLAVLRIMCKNDISVTSEADITRKLPTNGGRFLGAHLIALPGQEDAKRRVTDFQCELGHWNIGQALPPEEVNCFHIKMSPFVKINPEVFRYLLVRFIRRLTPSNVGYMVSLTLTPEFYEIMKKPRPQRLGLTWLA